MVEKIVFNLFLKKKPGPGPDQTRTGKKKPGPDQDRTRTIIGLDQDRTRN